MKVTLDLSKLLKEGKLSPAEAQRLHDLAPMIQAPSQSTSSLASELSR